MLSVRDVIAADKVIYSMNTGTYMVPIIRNEMDFPDAGSMNAAYKRMDFLWDEAALAAETDNVSEELKTAKESLVSIRDKAEVIRDDIVTARTVLEDEPAEIIKSELGQIEEDMAQLQDEIELCDRTISNETVRNEALMNVWHAERCLRIILRFMPNLSGCVNAEIKSVLRWIRPGRNTILLPGTRKIFP